MLGTLENCSLNYSCLFFVLLSNVTNKQTNRGVFGGIRRGFTDRGTRRTALGPLAVNVAL